MKTVALWDFDIVWLEELREGLGIHGVFCDEIDEREELRKKLEEKNVFCILSQNIYQEMFPMLQYQKAYLEAIVLVLEHEDTGLELSALRAGVSEVIIKEKGAEIAIERILLLLEKNQNRKGSIVLQEKKGAFESEFSGIHFTDLENHVLYEMFRKEEQVISREELIQKFWKQEEKNIRVVDTVMKQLRKKIKKTDYGIQGIYGKGYLLKKTIK